MVEIVDGKLIRDDATKNARGGTELLAQRIIDNVDPDLLQNIQIIFSRPNELLDGYSKILYLHDLPEDPAIVQFADPAFRQQFDYIVFVSHYQRQRFGAYFGCALTHNMIVIKNAIEPIPYHHKPLDKVRLIYHTTPHRGLSLLYPVFDKLTKDFPGQLELKVFSSFDIYGWGERDQQFDRLLKSCQDHPDIVYSKSVSNDDIRHELQKAHIFAFPSIWEETSCLALIEAMSANLDCIHSDLGALPETSFGLTPMYPFVSDPSHHATILYYNLFDLIRDYHDGHTRDSKIIVERYHTLDNFKHRWEGYLRELKFNGSNTKEKGNQI